MPRPRLRKATTLELSRKFRAYFGGGSIFLCGSLLLEEGRLKAGAMDLDVCPGFSRRDERASRVGSGRVVAMVVSE